LAKFSVIIAAAGKGERYGGKQNKVFAKLKDRPLFIRAIEMFINRDDVCQTILAVSPNDAQYVKDQYGPNLGFMGVTLVEGGAHRWQTIANGLEAVSEEAEFVAVHDAARICTTSEMIDRVFAEATKSGAAILAVPLSGTIKRVSGAGVVDETVPREGLFEAQTPQVFRKETLCAAYADVTEGTEATDDAEIVGASGHDVTVVDCDMRNMKITYSGDLALAGAIIKSRPKPKAPRPRGPFEEAQW